MVAQSKCLIVWSRINLSSTETKTEIERRDKREDRPDKVWTWDDDGDGFFVFHSEGGRNYFQRYDFLRPSPNDAKGGSGRSSDDIISIGLRFWSLRSECTASWSRPIPSRLEINCAPGYLRNIQPEVSSSFE